MQKTRVPAPADRIEFRCDSAENPGLAARFHALLALHGGDRAAILRALVLAYCERVEEDDKLPKLPLAVTPRKKLK